MLRSQQNKTGIHDNFARGVERRPLPYQNPALGASADWNQVMKL